MKGGGLDAKSEDAASAVAHVPQEAIHADAPKNAVDARAQGPAAAALCFPKFTSKSVAGAHAVHVGPDGAADASKDAEPASTVAAEALFYRGWTILGRINLAGLRRC